MPVIHNLPAQPTPFVGRVDELAEIAHLLGDPACRLLTLVGPGGIGKTRLSMQVMMHKSSDFADGAYFVALAPVGSADGLVPTIANALHFQFFESSNPAHQLFDYLGEKRMLLVLDNFEHLLDGVELLSAMLAASNVHLLVTSRERLNLVEEWVFELGGLSFPASEAEAEIEGYSAVHLFIECANRARVGFTITEPQKRVVSHICRMVGGMPLAIELAAAWVHALSCDAIADELARSLDILETSARNMPPRHRNMRAAIEPTWQRLGDTERDVFKRLAVFRGGLTRDAAQAVAGATRRTLSALVNKSLLQMDTSGRYSLHELLRQFAEEQLNASPQEYAQALDLHSAFYADFVQQWRDNLDHRTVTVRDFLDAVDRDIENIRFAFDRAIDQNDWQALQKFKQTFFYDVRGRYLEAETLFGRAVTHLKEHSDKQNEAQQKLLAWYLEAHARCLWGLAQYEQAKQLAYEALALLRPLPPCEETVDVLNQICYLAYDHAEARQAGEESVAIARAIQYPGLDGCTQNLGVNAIQRGDYAAAKMLLGEALTLSHAINDRTGTAWSLCFHSWIALCEDDYTNARRYAWEALAVAEEIGLWMVMWFAYYRLGAVARTEENYTDAKQFYQKSLDVLKTGNNRRALVFALGGLGWAACGLGDYGEAQRYLAEALTIAEHIRNPSAELYALGAAAELLAKFSQVERAVELGSLVVTHPYTRRDGRNHAAHLLARLERKLSPETFQAAQARGRKMELRAEEAAMLSILSQPMQPPLLSVVEARHPLTKREIEILCLMVEGLSNRDIAERLFLTPGTVKWYLSEIYSKLGVNGRMQAVARARELELLT